MILILWGITFPFVLAGDLSKINCPTNFDMAAENVTSSSQTDIITTMTPFYELIRGYGNSQLVETVVIEGKTANLQSHFLAMSYPFIAVAAIFLITYCIIISCCIFQKSCPPCQSWKRDFVKRPYEKSQLRCVTYFMFLFAAVTMVLAIAAFTSLPNLQKSAQNTKCGLYSILDAGINGDGVSWGGFSKLKDLLSSISSALNGAQTSINTYFGDNTWLINDTRDMDNRNLNFWNTYNTSTLFNPDPNNVTNITSYFISGSLGPNGTADTMVTDIDAGLQITKQLTDAAIEVDQSAKVLADSVASIQNNVNVSKAKLQMYNTQLEKFNLELDLFSGQWFDQFFTWGIYAMQGIVGFILASCLMALAGGIATHCFDMYNCRTMVHLSWGIMGLMYFGVLVMTYVFLPGASIASDFCKVYKQTLTSQTDYGKFGDYYSQNILTKLNVCIYGNGSILDTFNSLNEMDTVSNMFAQISVYDTKTNTSHLNYVNLTKSTQKISNWITTVENYRDGKFYDASSTDLSNSNPHVCIDTLNGYTLRAAGLQNCSQDNWVYDNVNCTFGMSVYTPGATVAQGTFLQTTPVCFSFNSKLQTTSTSIWTQSDFNARYVSIMANCSTAYANIIKYGFSIIKYRDSRINIYKSISSDLNDLLSSNNAYNSKLGVFRSNLSAFSSAVSTLNSLMNDKLSGLGVSSNCTVLSTYMSYTYNEFCIKFMSEVSRLGIYFMLLSLVMIGSIITASVFAIKYARVDRNRATVVPQMSTTKVQDKDSEQSSQFQDLD